jgi:hypothetical protein
MIFEIETRSIIRHQYWHIIFGKDHEPPVILLLDCFYPMPKIQKKTLSVAIFSIKRENVNIDIGRGPHIPHLLTLLTQLPISSASTVAAMTIPFILRSRTLVIIPTGACTRTWIASAIKPGQSRVAAAVHVVDLRVRAHVDSLRSWRKCTYWLV